MPRLVEKDSTYCVTVKWSVENGIENSSVTDYQGGEGEEISMILPS